MHDPSLPSWVPPWKLNHIAELLLIQLKDLFDSVPVAYITKQIYQSGDKFLWIYFHIQYQCALTFSPIYLYFFLVHLYY